MFALASELLDGYAKNEPTDMITRVPKMDQAIRLFVTRLIYGVRKLSAQNENV